MMKIKRRRAIVSILVVCLVLFVFSLLTFSFCHFNEDTNAVSVLTGKKVLFDGDSIAKGYVNPNDTSNDWSYADYLKETYNLTSTNLAVSGARFYWPGADEEKVIPNHLTSSILNQTYDYIILEGAINDLHDNNYNVDPNLFKNAFKSYLNTVTSNSKWQNSKIGFVIPPHPDYSIRTSWDSAKEKAFWQDVKAILDSYSIEYINFFKLSSNDGNVVPNGFDYDIITTTNGSNDGLHPTRSAHAILGGYIATWMEGLPNYKYTVTFDKNGATMSNINSQTIIHGKTASRPTVNIDSNQYFKHWSLSKNGAEYNFSSPVNENITLYAVWAYFEDPTLNFTTTGSINKTYGDVAFTNAATSNSDGAITYTSSNTDVATVNTAGKVTIKNVGTTTITATIAASGNYNGKSTSYTLNVNKITSRVPDEATDIKTAFVGDSLSSIIFNTEGIEWLDDDTVVSVGENNYLAEYTENGDKDHYTTIEVEIKVMGKRRVYVTVLGDKQKYILEGEGYISFKIDADFSLFEEGGTVYIDDKLLEQKFYKAKAGSVTIDISNAYLSTLSAGDHNLRVYFNNGGYSDAMFTLVLSSSDMKVPDTGDGILEDTLGQGGWEIDIMLVMCVIAVVLGIIEKYKIKTNKISFDNNK